MTGTVTGVIAVAAAYAGVLAFTVWLGRRQRRHLDTRNARLRSLAAHPAHRTPEQYRPKAPRPEEAN